MRSIDFFCEPESLSEVTSVVRDERGASCADLSFAWQRGRQACTQFITESDLLTPKGFIALGMLQIFKSEQNAACQAPRNDVALLSVEVKYKIFHI